MIDWQSAFTFSKWFYVTGITAALSPGAGEATLEALRLARAGGATTFLDPNYRAKLWSVEQAAAWLNKAIAYVDVLITIQKMSSVSLTSPARMPRRPPRQLPSASSSRPSP
jgi:2-dehydro-3-deoxygluconokinase